ncbi:uncharacterized protein LOC126988721 isoform X2 [Eriocheir sinensis]|uniref:uncharacterized protein LOC126988721 isoform X2 n=1 Tax=Eriocheir sinensis TaxID=95602 RepID=UPI0021C72A80|nr:uncharacterized protein LOC126988721 isoform X2 [Eriocheir sinensis]
MAVSYLHATDAGHFSGYTSDSSAMGEMNNLIMDMYEDQDKNGCESKRESVAGRRDKLFASNTQTGTDTAAAAAKSQDYVPQVKRQRCEGLSSAGHASEDSLEALCGAKLSRWADAERQLTQTQPGRNHCELWVTAVISGTGFFALTWEERNKADIIRECLVDQMEDAPTMCKGMVARMICSLWVDESWERVKTRRRCTRDFCQFRKEKEPLSPQEYWHVTLMEVGTYVCVPRSRLYVITGELAEERCQAKLYFLRRILLNDDKTNSEMAMKYLKELLQPDTKLKVEMFQPWGRRWTHVEVLHGDGYLSDILVEAGFARYSRPRKQHDQKEMFRAAICSSQDLISVSSINSHASHHMAPLQYKKSDPENYTVPKFMDFINHVIKQRKTTAHLTSSWSTLSQAMKAQSKERFLQLPGLRQHGYVALNKYQILLRKLKNEYPHIHELKDLKESYYKQLEGVFEKWKLNYMMAQKKTDEAIDVIASVFLGFTNGNVGLGNYTNKCKNLETALTNEATILHKGQELAQMVVPAVATKLMHTIEKLESSSMGCTHMGQRPQTLHQFIKSRSSRNITPLTLEILATDILKDLNQYHMRGIAYQHLHPGNVLVTNGHASLRPIDSQTKFSTGEGWAFERFNYAKPLTKADDVFNFGLLLLWMACKGDKYYDSIMKYYCNMALIKMAMAKDPDQRPLVESLLSTNSPIYRSNHLWQRTPLNIYLTEVFSERVAIKVGEENVCQSLEMEACEFTSDSESLLQPHTKEESDSENPGVEATISEPLSPASTEGGAKETLPPRIPVDDDSLDLTLSDACP